MMSRRDLKIASKEQLKGKWGVVGGTFLLLGVISFILAFIPIVGMIGIFLITGPIMLGQAYMVLKLINNDSISIKDGFQGFKYFGKGLGLYFLQGVFIFLWSLLLWIPGIIKAFAYSMAIYIIAENPEIGIREALKESQRITKGHKFDLFILSLSFLGWALLSTITLGIGYFWLVPYIQTTYANTYKTLKNQYSTLNTSNQLLEA